MLIGGIGSTAITLAYREAPHRVAIRSRLSLDRTSKAARVLASMGLPSPGVVGVRFALEPGGGRTGVPVRLALLGAVLAVAMVVAALTFGGSLQTLISRPALYGWNWSYVLNATNNTPPQALALLARDHDVAAWTGADHNDAEIDRQAVPVLYGDTGAALTPPILAGHAVLQKNQIVLGAATLAQLHKRIGDTVRISFGQRRDAPLYIPPTPLVIVGTATMPAVGSSGILRRPHVHGHRSTGLDQRSRACRLPESPAWKPGSHAQRPQPGVR